MARGPSPGSCAPHSLLAWDEPVPPAQMENQHGSPPPRCESTPPRLMSAVIVVPYPRITYMIFSISISSSGLLSSLSISHLAEDDSARHALTRNPARSSLTLRSTPQSCRTWADRCFALEMENRAPHPVSMNLGPATGTLWQGVERHGIRRRGIPPDGRVPVGSADREWRIRRKGGCHAC